MHEDGESNTRMLEETEGGRQIFKRSGRSDVGDAGMEIRRRNEFGRSRGFAERKLASEGMNTGRERKRRVR